jgi:manganese/zinc/iron transport system permease protein
MNGNWQEFIRVFALYDYNTRVVVLGTTLLGIAAGLIGTFMLLRKRALMSDALSHATLPGIGLAFIVMASLGAQSKSLPVLLLGGLLSSIVAAVCVLAIRRYTRLKEDAALGIVLSVFFGLGVAVLGVIQKMRTGSAAGLESFIYGKTASMVYTDAQMIAGTAGIVALVCAALFKEFASLCFDSGYARSQGWPVVKLDVLMMGLVVLVTVIGLQAVGLILMIALLIIPAAAARFWTDHLRTMVLVSACTGGLSGWFGASLSALVPRLPAGAVIVLIAGLFFGISMILGTARGVLQHVVAHHRLCRKITRQNLLRAMYELAAEASGREPAGQTDLVGIPVSFDQLLARRSWSPRHLGRTIRAACRDGLAQEGPGRVCTLSRKGVTYASRLVRNHRLWELYLITYADIAASHVDRDADQVEHVLDPEIMKNLEGLLEAEVLKVTVPPSPHA